MSLYPTHLAGHLFVEDKGRRGIAPLLLPAVLLLAHFPKEERTLEAILGDEHLQGVVKDQ